MTKISSQLRNARKKSCVLESAHLGRIDVWLFRKNIPFLHIFLKIVSLKIITIWFPEVLVIMNYFEDAVNTFLMLCLKYTSLWTTLMRTGVQNMWSGWDLKYNLCDQGLLLSQPHGCERAKGLCGHWWWHPLGLWYIQHFIWINKGFKLDKQVII